MFDEIQIKLYLDQVKAALKILEEATAACAVINRTDVTFSLMYAGDAVTNLRMAVRKLEAV